MTRKMDIYKCSVCDTLVEVLDQTGMELICCGRQMNMMREQIGGILDYQHSPIVEKLEQGIRVSVGPTPHPMKSQHYIKWIEVIADGRCFRQFLNPGDQPEAIFNIEARVIIVRAYCNLHGLWKAAAPLLLPAREIQAEAI